MKDTNTIDFSQLDRPEVLFLLFHPRGESGWTPPGAGYEELAIPTEEGTVIGGRLYPAGAQAPTLLFFHGNGEIVEDYGDLGEAWVRMGVNFLPIDYRGYGRSTGKPSVTGMMRDCHYAYDFTQRLLEKRRFTGPLIVMGRSLGSAPALELAATYGDDIKGLIVESGFARLVPLLRLLGVDTEELGLTGDGGLGNLDKIGGYSGPALVIHAERDHIIPFSDGKALFDACPSAEKRFLEIKRANHNNILQYGINEYFHAIGELLARASES